MPTRIPAASLEALLADALAADVASVEIVRSQYATSFPIDELNVVLADGTERALVRKDLSWSSLLPEARRAKPPFVYEPRREMSVYRTVLPLAPSGPPRCYGIVDRPRAGLRWLFLERLTGVELFQVGDLTQWEAAARWAGRFHVRFAGRAEELHAAGVPLLVHDWPWLQRWADRAVAGAGRDNHRALRHLRMQLRALWVRLADQPTTVVHGELYASNVVVTANGREPRVSPVDWEMAAVAPALVDLAALTAGNWSASDRRTLEAAYASAVRRPLDDQFAAELDACRLAMCIQWLGWRPRWRAPHQHRHDWLGEALLLADRLEL